MKSTARNRAATGAAGESRNIAENLLALMAKNRDTQEALAAFCGLTARTLRGRLDRPSMFRVEELEAAAMRYDVTVRQLLAPMRFEE